MSDILIKGMEMPTTGLYFVSVDNAGGRDKTVVTVERMLGNRDVRQVVGSFELVPVPDHGDLIERDAMQKEWYQLNFDRKISDGTLAYWNYCLEQMPTIIPADHADKEE